MHRWLISTYLDHLDHLLENTSLGLRVTAEPLEFHVMESKGTGAIYTASITAYSS